jgi:hypothetical protein
MGIEPEPDAAAVVDIRPWRLVVARPAWEMALRSLLIKPDVCATGNLRWNTTHTSRELLIEAVTINGQAPTGQARLPLADWFVLCVASANESNAAMAALANRFQPKPGQLLVIVRFDARNRTRWDAVITKEGELTPLSEIHIVGSEMLKLSRHDDISPQLPQWVSRRWSRTAGALGEDVVRRLRKSTVTLVAAGRNGSALALQFAALGVRRLRIIDPDILALENLDAMPGLAARDVGWLKLTALGRRLRQFRPDLKLSLLPKPVTDAEAVKLLHERTDVLVTAVGNDTPRLAAAIIARQTVTVHLDVGTSIQRTADGNSSITGDIRLLLPGEGCVACVGGLANLKDTLDDLHAPPGSLRRRLRPSWHEERQGSLISINAITVGAGVQAWLDLLGGRLRSSFWQRIAWIPGRGLDCAATAVGSADDCRFCHPE